MLNRLHLIAGVVGFLTILTFWLSTVTSEVFGSIASVTTVKEMIPWGFLVVVPALAITGLSGFRMAGASTDPRIVGKRRRMPIVAANGIFVLIPAALYLATLASRGDFGPLFYGVQAIELVADAVNLTLMSLNIRDGLSLTARRRVRDRRPGNFQRT
jgi:hypothetical protein